MHVAHARNKQIMEFTLLENVAIQYCILVFIFQHNCTLQCNKYTAQKKRYTRIKWKALSEKPHECWVAPWHAGKWMCTVHCTVTNLLLWWFQSWVTLPYSPSSPPLLSLCSNKDFSSDQAIGTPVQNCVSLGSCALLHLSGPSHCNESQPAKCNCWDSASGYAFMFISVIQMLYLTQVRWVRCWCKSPVRNIYLSCSDQIGKIYTLML